MFYGCYRKRADTIRPYKWGGFMRKRRVLVVICAFVALLCLLAMTLPVFTVKPVTVTGVAALSNTDVIKAAGLDKKTNFFTVSVSGIKKNLLGNPYVDSAEVTKVFPNNVLIHIDERKVYGYVWDTGNFIYIDKDGRVLEVSDSFTERLPVIIGLKYKSYSKGEVLEVDAPSAFNTVVLLANLFKAYELEHNIITVDIKNEDDIRLYVSDIEVKMGSVSEVYDKIRYLKEILPLIENEKGTLDLNTSYKDEAARFRPLT